MADPFAFAPGEEIAPAELRRQQIRMRSPETNARWERGIGMLGRGLLDWVNLPGRALGTVVDERGPPSMQEMADWGAGTALGMVGPGGVPRGAVGSGAGRGGLGRPGGAREDLFT